MIDFQVLNKDLCMGLILDFWEFCGIFLVSKYIGSCYYYSSSCLLKLFIRQTQGDSYTFHLKKYSREIL